MEPKGSVVKDIGALVDFGKVQPAGSDFYRKPYAGTSAAPKVTDLEKIRDDRVPENREDILIDSLVNKIL